MNFFTVRDFRSSPKKIWETLKEKREIIITNNGKPSALMIPLGEDDFDSVISTYRQVNAIRAVNNMQRAAMKAGLDDMTLDEINSIIDQTRKDSAV